MELFLQGCLVGSLMTDVSIGHFLRRHGAENPAAMKAFMENQQMNWESAYLGACMRALVLLVPAVAAARALFATANGKRRWFLDLLSAVSIGSASSVVWSVVLPQLHEILASGTLPARRVLLADVLAPYRTLAMIAGLLGMLLTTLARRAPTAWVELPVLAVIFGLNFRDVFYELPYVLGGAARADELVRARDRARAAAAAAVGPRGLTRRPPRAGGTVQLGRSRAPVRAHGLCALGHRGPAHRHGVPRDRAQRCARVRAPCRRRRCSYARAGLPFNIAMFVVLLLSGAPLFSLFVEPYEFEMASYVEAGKGDVSAVPSDVARHHLPIINAAHFYMMTTCAVGAWLLQRHVATERAADKRKGE